MSSSFTALFTCPSMRKVGVPRSISAASTNILSSVLGFGTFTQIVLPRTNLPLYYVFYLLSRICIIPFLVSIKFLVYSQNSRIIPVFLPSYSHMIPSFKNSYIITGRWQPWIYAILSHGLNTKSNSSNSFYNRSPRVVLDGTWPWWHMDLM